MEKDNGNLGRRKEAGGMERLTQGGERRIQGRPQLMRVVQPRLPRGLQFHLLGFGVSTS